MKSLPPVQPNNAECSDCNSPTANGQRSPRVLWTKSETASDAAT